MLGPYRDPNLSASTAPRFCSSSSASHTLWQQLNLDFSECYKLSDVSGLGMAMGALKELDQLTLTLT